MKAADWLTWHRLLRGAYEESSASLGAHTKKRPEFKLTDENRPIARLMDDGKLDLGHTALSEGQVHALIAWLRETFE